MKIYSYTTDEKGVIVEKVYESMREGSAYKYIANNNLVTITEEDFYKIQGEELKMLAKEESMAKYKDLVSELSKPKELYEYSFVNNKVNCRAYPLELVLGEWCFVDKTGVYVKVEKQNLDEIMPVPNYLMRSLTKDDLKYMSELRTYLNTQLGTLDKAIEEEKKEVKKAKAIEKYPKVYIMEVVLPKLSLKELLESDKEQYEIEVVCTAHDVVKQLSNLLVLDDKTGVSIADLDKVYGVHMATTNPDKDRFLEMFMSDAKINHTSLHENMLKVALGTL